MSYQYRIDYGCGDGSCIFKHRPEHFGGMCTNGGCHCLLYDAHRDVPSRLRAQKGILAMREYIKELKEKK